MIKKKACILCTFFTVCLIYIILVFIEPQNVEVRLLGKKVISASENKLILVWNDMFKKKNWGFHQMSNRDFIDRKCSVTNCIVTDDRSKLSEASAVMFHQYVNDRPSYKLQDQRWVFFSFEAPNYHPVKPYRNLINWIQSFRLDADIFMPYYNYYKRDVPVKIDYGAILKQKTKLVAWFVSECGTISGRDYYVRTLMKFISIDVYGACSFKFFQYNKCGKGKDCKNRILNNDYKFYLSFENTLYKDYVTEKYFQMLDLNIVPIVRGDGNYSAIGPPHSFINTKDFSSIRDLADYLKYLDQNDEEYIKYLKYKENYVLDEPTWPVLFRTNHKQYDNGWCLLCRKLNDPNEFFKRYENLEKWYGKIREPDDIEIGLLEKILDKILEVFGRILNLIFDPSK